AIEARQRVERGEDPDEAAFVARRVFGNVGRIREQTRETWGWTDVERFFDDVRHGLRMLMKTPGWTAVMGATLALGIGLAAAIFSIVYGVLLQPLPYPEPERLVALWTTAPERGMPRLNVGAANWLDWRAEA